MLNHNGYAAYANSKIMTASPAELTLMLYDGAIKFCNIAIAGIEENNIEKAHNNIRKVEDIISEFQATLNHKYATADDFNNVYVYLKERLIEANMKKDKEILEEENGGCSVDVIDDIFCKIVTPIYPSLPDEKKNSF